MKVFYEWSDDKYMQWIFPIHLPRFQAIMTAKGWPRADSMADADVCYREDHWLSRVPPDRPTVCLCRMDTSWVPHRAQKWDAHEHIKAFVLPLVTSEPESSICNQVFGSTASPELSTPVLPFNTLLPQVMHQAPYYTMLDMNKKWDAVFIGTMHHHGAPFVKQHRASLRRHWHQLDHLNTLAVFVGDYQMGYAFDWKRSWELVSRAKVVVCPWGVCEISWRDYEAALSRAVLVKPRQPHMIVDPNPWQHVVYCEPDFIDLREAVDKAMDYHAKNDLGAVREEMMAHSSFESLADKLVGIFEKAFKC